MEEKIRKDLFVKAMEANNLEFEERDNELIIKKSKERNTSIRLYTVLSTVGIILGLILFLFLGRIGIVVMGISIPALFVTVNLREREKDSEKKTVAIGAERIDIREGFKSKKVNLQDISEFKTNVERYRNLYVGNIAIVTEGGMSYEFLEIFGNDEVLVQDDLIIISNYIIENFISV